MSNNMVPAIRMKHISHNDLDGYASTILSKFMQHCLPDGYMTLETMNILPNRLISSVKDTIAHFDEYDRIVITDLAINPEVVRLIKESPDPKKFLVFDHHDTTLTGLPESFFVTKNSPHHPGKDTCATELYYNFFKKDTVYSMIYCQSRKTPYNLDHFVNCVRIYDTYEFWKTRNNPDYKNDIALSDAPRLNTLFHILERDAFENYILDYLDGNIDWMMLTVSTPNYPLFTPLLEIENAKNQRYVESALRRMFITSFNVNTLRDGKKVNFHYTCGVVFAEKNGPVIGNTACEMNPQIDFCAVVSNNQVSLYTNRPDVNVAPIAQGLGGGGHSDAAGFTISYNMATIFNTNHFIDIISCAAKTPFTAGE